MQLDGLFGTLIGDSGTITGNHRCTLPDGGRCPAALTRDNGLERRPRVTRHPGQVRTLTLISGTPLNIPLFERRPGNAQQALDYVFDLCQSQPACHRAFPHLAADWAALWASLGKSPWILPAAQSPTGKTERLDQDIVAAMVYQAL